MLNRCFVRIHQSLAAVQQKPDVQMLGGALQSLFATVTRLMTSSSSSASAASNGSNVLACGQQLLLVASCPNGIILLQLNYLTLLGLCLMNDCPLMCHPKSASDLGVSLRGVFSHEVGLSVPDAAERLQLAAHRLAALPALALPDGKTHQQV